MIVVGDARALPLPDGCAQAVVTSPPYWQQRDYDTERQIGQERSPESFIAELVIAFGEARRVLRDDGTCWINIGDSYAASGHGGGGSLMQTRGGGAWASRSRLKGWRSPPKGYKRKDLVGIPSMLARALRDDGWYWRSEIIWDKATGGIVRPDRPWSAHETILLMSKSERYKFTDFGRHLGSVWRFVPTNANANTAHEAAFVTELPARCIQASTEEGDLICDPFAGTGTTGIVATRYGRRFIGIELNPEYARTAKQRIDGDSPLLAWVE